MLTYSTVENAPCLALKNDNEHLRITLKNEKVNEEGKFSVWLFNNEFEHIYDILTQYVAICTK